jgi:hypothetical protein
VGMVYIYYVLNTYQMHKKAVIGMAMPVALTLEGRLEKLVELFMKEGYATSKAEVVRMGLMKLEEDLHDKETDERRGWMMLSAKTMKKIWDNPKDEEAWSKYY